MSEARKTTLAEIRGQDMTNDFLRVIIRERNDLLAKCRTLNDLIAIYEDAEKRSSVKSTLPRAKTAACSGGDEEPALTQSSDGRADGRALALASAARAMRAANPQPQRVTPPALVTAVTRRALNNAPPAATGKPLSAPAPKDTRNEIADNRRPRNELQGRLLNEALRGTTSFRPDPPAEKRGAVNVTSELMGDPPAHRSALAAREAGR